MQKETELSDGSLSESMDEEKKPMQLERGIEELERKQAELKNDISEMENQVIALSLESNIFKALVNNVVLDQQDSEDVEEEKVFDLMIQKRVIEETEGTRRVRKLQNEIQVLELMLARGTVGLLDMQMMEDEIEELRKSEEAVGKAMEMKVGELQEGLWELKREIVEVKSRKYRELMSLVESDGEERRKEGKVRMNWYGVVVAVGVVVTVAAYKFLVGKPKFRAGERQ